METAYQQQTLRSANAIELVIALYDGAIRFLYRAIQCIGEGDEIGLCTAVKRTIDIISYLQARLRTDIGGRPAAALADFYTAMFTLTLEASHIASPKHFEEVIACLRNVRDAWLIVAHDPETRKILPRDLRSQSERYAVAPSSPVSCPVIEVEESVHTNWSA